MAQECGELWAVPGPCFGKCAFDLAESALDLGTRFLKNIGFSFLKNLCIF